MNYLFLLLLSVAYPLHAMNSIETNELLIRFNVGNEGTLTYMFDLYSLAQSELQATPPLDNILIIPLDPSTASLEQETVNYKLIDAASNGILSSVSLLLTQGADVNAKDYRCTDKLPRLTMAESKITISPGESSQKANKYYGWSALKLAAYHKHYHVVTILLSHGATVHPDDSIEMLALSHDNNTDDEKQIQRLQCQGLIPSFSLTVTDTKIEHKINTDLAVFTIISDCDENLLLQYIIKKGSLATVNAIDQDKWKYPLPDSDALATLYAYAIRFTCHEAHLLSRHYINWKSRVSVSFLERFFMYLSHDSGIQEVILYCKIVNDNLLGKRYGALVKAIVQQPNTQIIACEREFIKNLLTNDYLINTPFYQDIITEVATSACGIALLKEIYKESSEVRSAIKPTLQSIAVRSKLERILRANNPANTPFTNDLARMVALYLNQDNLGRYI